METGSSSSSSCKALQVVRGSHFFVVADYNLNKEIGIGNFMRSSNFTVGGYVWSIRYYPDGFNRRSRKHISVFVELMTDDATVRIDAFFRVVAIPQGSGWMGPGVARMSRSEGPRGCISGCEQFFERAVLDASPYILNDRLALECCVVILQNPLVMLGTGQHLANGNIKIPPSELSNDFAKLLASKEGADVSFSVQGKVFQAHSVVLAARSPVFKAELFGQMMEKKGSAESSIVLEDVLPDVFAALLHFMYTDALPHLNDFHDDDDKLEFLRHLLEAADRYQVKRLKLICETMLSKTVDAETVATTLALADQHQCKHLKDACIKFMESPTRMDKVVASQDYGNLKRMSPNLALEVLESLCKSKKT